MMLVVTGLLSVAGVATGCDVQSLVTIRYHLLLAWAPVGVTALAFVLAPGVDAAASAARVRPLAVVVMSTAIALWSAGMAWQHLRLLHEYRTTPPPSAYRELADDLVAHGQDRESCLHGASRTQKMSDCGFRGRHGHLTGCIADDPLDGPQLDLVAKRRRCSVCIDVIDFGR